MKHNIGQIAIILLINLVFFSLAQALHLQRVWFDVDYLLCFFLFAYHYRKTASVLLAIFCVSDILLLAKQIFPFFRLADIIYVLKFIVISSGHYQFYLFMGLLLVLAIVIFYNKITINKKILIYVSCLLSLIFLLESIYSVVNYNYKRKIIDSQFVNFVLIQYDGFTQTLNLPQEELIIYPYSRTSKQLFTDINHKTLNNQGVLYIVAESLGKPKSNEALQAMIAPLLAQKDRFDYFDMDKFIYDMPTVHGELRELCHAWPANFNLRHLQKGFEDCLPNKIKQLGYETTALHGSMSIMYDRKYWYPRAGFDKTIFYENQTWQKQCYSFPGACDVELVNIVADVFKQDKKQFLYWLTLNSHATYDKRDIFIDKFDCQRYGIDKDSESCRNLKLQRQFFEILAELIQKPQMRGVEVFIVGDHTPVIFNQQQKEQYFDDRNVLILKFKIKN